MHLGRSSDSWDNSGSDSGVVSPVATTGEGWDNSGSNSPPVVSAPAPKISGDSGQTADVTPPGAVAMVNQATIDFFNSTYNVHFIDPKDYYDKWVFGGNGTIIPSTDPAQDTSMYYLPEHGNANAPIHTPLSYTPPDSLDFKIIRGLILAAGVYAGTLAYADAFTGASTVVQAGGVDPLTVTPFDMGLTDAGAADLQAAAAQGASSITTTVAEKAAGQVVQQVTTSGGVDPLTITQADMGLTDTGAADLAKFAGETGGLDPGGVAMPDVSLPAEATAAESAAHTLSTAGAMDAAISAAGKALPIITGALSAGTALYRALNPLSPTGQTLTPAQQDQLRRRLNPGQNPTLTPAQQLAQNKNILLIGAIAAGIFLPDSIPLG